MTTADLITGIDVDHTQYPRRGQIITRLSWRGWQVDLDGLSVRVPSRTAPTTASTTWPPCYTPPTRCSISRSCGGPAP